MSDTDPRRSRWIANASAAADDRPSLRLFLLPFAGGGASAYRGWARGLSGRIEVCPVQLPGRENRMAERLHTALPPLVAELSQALAPLLDRPYALFGHSMGALVGFELARALARQGRRRPACVVLSGFRSPLLPQCPTLPYDLPTDVFLSRLRQLEGTPPEALDSPELMEAILPILRADCEVCDLYRMTDPTPLNSPLTVFGGEADPEADEPAMRAWAPLAGAGFAVQMFSGGHFFVQHQREAVLRALDEALAPHLAALG